MLLIAAGVAAYVVLQRRRRKVAPVTRVLALAALIAAATLTGLLMFGGGGDGYTLTARFENAGQVVRGGLVEIAGRQVGTVTGQRLTDDGMAELTLKIEDDWAPIPRGTHAQIRQFGLSGPASRYIELRLPTGEQRGPDLPDGAQLGLEDTTSNVDIDEIFAIFDRRTRESLKGVIRGSARQYSGEGRAGERRAPVPRPGARVRQPAVRRAEPRHAQAAPLHQGELRAGGRPGRPARRPRLAGEQPGRHHRARSRGRAGALGDAIQQLPPFMRRANTTYVNLRATLDDLDPLVRDFKPVAKKLRPYTAELRRLVQDAQPTVRDLVARDPQARRRQRPGGAGAPDPQAARHRGRPRAA